MDIMASFKSLIKIMSAGLAAILAALGFVTPDATFKAAKPDEIQANFSVFSDIHVEGNNPTRQLIIAKGLDDVANAETKVDALVVTGDCTMNGQAVEYLDMAATFKVHNRTDKTFLIMGNHDACNRPGGFKEAETRFKRYQQIIGGNAIDRPYYSGRVNGYTFICMSTEADAGVEQYISDEQIAWLDAQLAEATKDGKPAFVFNHNPIKGTNNVDSIWPGGSMGAQSGKVLNVIRKYNDVFVFSGHMHTNMDRNGVTRDKVNSSIVYIDCPLFSNTSKFNGKEVSGVGYQVEVYENNVLIRGRCFEKSEWLDYDFDIALSGAASDAA